MNQPQQPEIFLTTKDVAKKLQVTTATIERWREDGILPFIKIGKRSIRYKESDINNALKNQKNG